MNTATAPTPCKPRPPRQPHPNVVGLHEGWVAARRDEPFDPMQSLAWQEGYNLWKGRREGSRVWV